MTRSDLIATLALRFHELTHDDADSAVKAILAALADALACGDRAEIRGFGSFEVTHRQAKMGRNPKSGKPVYVPAKRMPHFKPGKEMRERVGGPGVASTRPR